jgi:hypothetical protein
MAKEKELEVLIIRGAPLAILSSLADEYSPTYYLTADRLISLWTILKEAPKEVIVVRLESSLLYKLSPFVELALLHTSKVSIVTARTKYNESIIGQNMAVEYASRERLVERWVQ